jgi:[ribosomal protein S18]-alanine N-acetyltransferase
MLSNWILGHYTLRGMAVADVPAVTELERLCFCDAWLLEKVESFLLTQYEGHERLGLLAFRQNRLVGYALITMGAGILAFERLGIVPDERRKRVGTKLITVAMLEGRVRGLEKMSVVVRESNPGAQRFFHECGFRASRITDELRGWFGTEDGVAMRRLCSFPKCWPLAWLK